MKSIIFAILALGLCLARSAQAENLYLPKGYSLPQGVESYTPSQVNDVLARLVGEEPQDESSYSVLPVANEFTSIVGAGPKAVSTVLLFVPKGSSQAEALKGMSTSATIEGSFLGSEKKNQMSATVLSQQRGIADQFENIFEIAIRRKKISDSIKTLQNNCGVATELSITLDGMIAYNGKPLFSADSDKVEKVFAELANICIFVSDEISRPSTDLTIIDAIFEMFDFGLTEDQKKFISEQKEKLIGMLIEAASKGNINLVGIEVDDVISALKPRSIEDDDVIIAAAEKSSASESEGSSSSEGSHKKKNRYGVLPAAKDLPEKQIFIWTGVLLVVTMAVVFVMMLGVGVDCERDTLLSRMVSL